MSSQIKIKNRGENFKKFMKKYGYFIVVGLIVVAVTLSIVLTQAPKENSKNLDIVDKPPVEAGAIALNFALPMSDCQLVHDFSRSAVVKNETMGWFETHKGVDLKGSKNDVYASESGEVVKIYTNNLEGTVVEIKHNENITTRYSSLDSKTNVKVGDKVKKGQKIGEASTSAGEEKATGAHLHFEILKDNEQVNPNDYLTLQNK